MVMNCGFEAQHCGFEAQHYLWDCGFEAQHCGFEAQHYLWIAGLRPKYNARASNPQLSNILIIQYLAIRLFYPVVQ